MGGGRGKGDWGGGDGRGGNDERTCRLDRLVEDGAQGDGRGLHGREV